MTLCAPPVVTRLLLVAALGLTPVALAQPRAFAVLGEVTPEAAPALESSLREMLGRLGVSLSSTSADAGSAALARIDVDLTGGRLLVESPARGLTIRRTFETSGPPEVVIEAAATLVASAVDVLLHAEPPRHPIAIAGAANGSAPAPSPPPARLSPVGLDVGVGLGARLLGTTTVDFGGSVQALLTVPLGAQLPGLLATLTYQPGFDLAGEALTLRGSLLSVRLFAQLELLRWRLGRLEAGAGGGVDRFAFTPLQREGELLRPMSPRASLAPIVTGVVTYRLPVGETVHVFASLTVDGDLRPPREAGPPPMNAPADASDPRPWTVRPMLLLGVSFAPFRARE